MKKPWMISTIVLAAALVALGTWVLVGDQTDAPQPLAQPSLTPLAEYPLELAQTDTVCLASEDVVRMLAARRAAMNRGDEQAAAAFYAEDGSLWLIDAAEPEVARGRAAIAALLKREVDERRIRLRLAGHAIRFGDYVAEPTFIGYEDADGKIPEWTTYLLVFNIEPSTGEINGQWVF